MGCKIFFGVSETIALIQYGSQGIVEAQFAEIVCELVPVAVLDVDHSQWLIAFRALSLHIVLQ